MLALVRLADEEAEHLLASVPDEKHRECWWFILRDGTPVAGDGGGGVLLLSELQRTRPLGRALGALRLSPLVDAGDKLLAKFRKHLGRFVPEGPAPRRYP
ncbi:MAG: hypothetical protein HKM89_13725 [Gemmatimonadales bacterium]|nr:hypothetical protein [Gemmatimonadales bacterium]